MTGPLCVLTKNVEFLNRLFDVAKVSSDCPYASLKKRGTHMARSTELSHHSFTLANFKERANLLIGFGDS